MSFEEHLDVAFAKLRACSYFLHSDPLVQLDYHLLYTLHSITAIPMELNVFGEAFDHESEHPFRHFTNRFGVGRFHNKLGEWLCLSLLLIHLGRVLEHSLLEFIWVDLFLEQSPWLSDRWLRERLAKLHISFLKSGCANCDLTFLQDSPWLITIHCRRWPFFHPDYFWVDRLVLHAAFGEIITWRVLASQGVEAHSASLALCGCK